MKKLANKINNSQLRGFERKMLSDYEYKQKQ